ncbi:MAG: PmoA family protein [Bryobacterales bacterium]|nr:PmoA family protein [Bryobacterales bacterium]
MILYRFSTATLCRLCLLLAATLLALTMSAFSQVNVSQKGDVIAITIDGKPYSELFLAGPKVYLHPLRSASGKIVSRLYPMEKREGETTDHVHHRGLWYGHGNVNGIDFWSNDPVYKYFPTKGGVEKLLKVIDTKSGKNAGSLKILLAWNDPHGNTMAEETREMVFRKQAGSIIIDTDLHIKAITDLKFGDTKEGTFALRMAPEFEAPGGKRTPAFPVRTGHMVNSNGVEGKDVWGKRASWVDYDAVVDGEKIGVAIFDNPRNPRYPTYWHARDYGLFAVNPFGVHDFENDKTKDGSMTVKAGDSVRFRYRIVIHPGDAKDAKIAAMFDAYAKSAR